jgi:hypothetical protein
MARKPHALVTLVQININKQQTQKANPTPTYTNKKLTQ